MATKAQLETAWQNPNARAFLDMISAAEGTTRYGYYTQFGGNRIASLAKHPGIAITVQTKRGPLTSTATGRYQFLKRTWNAVASQLQLPDFGPHSQDIAALQLIAQRGGLSKVLAGDVPGAIAAVRKEWASFPGAGYGQGERSLAYMLSTFATSLRQYGNAPAPNTAQNTPTGQSGSGGAALGVVMGLPPQMIAEHPLAFGSLGTAVFIGAAALAVYYLFIAE